MVGAARAPEAPSDELMRQLSAMQAERDAALESQQEAEHACALARLNLLGGRYWLDLSSELTVVLKKLLPGLGCTFYTPGVKVR